MTAGLDLRSLAIRRDQADLVRLSAFVPPGQVLTIMGASGSGKSTLLLALIGALPEGFDFQGQVLLNGRDVTHLPTQARRIGILFQDDVLFPHLSVGGNLAFALPRGTPDRSGAIARALQEMDLAGFEDRDPASLSGGQRARVALARCLLAGPEALLLDEPFSKLDADLRAQIRAKVFATTRARGLPVILVTHDAEDARAGGGPIRSPLNEPLSPSEPEDLRTVAAGKVGIG